MDMLRNEVRQLNPEQYTETKALDHASQQARARNYQDFLIVDVDAHHYESESYKDVFSYIENPVIKMEAMDSMSRAGRSGFLNSQVGYQSLGGRMTRHKNRAHFKGRGGKHRDIDWTLDWMDAMGVDYSCMFPTPMLFLGLHPQVEIEVALCRAYNPGCASASWRRSRASSRCCTCRSTIRNGPTAPCSDFGDKKGVVGFMVTSPRYKPVHDNAYMKTYALLEEMGKPISFHAAYSWDDRALATTNRFISVHSLGFMWFNMIHMTNWVDQRHPRALPQAQDHVGRVGPHLGLLPDAAARPLLHDAHLGLPAAQAQADRIHAGDVLLVAADGGAGRSFGAGGDLQDDQGGDAAGVVVGLSALGLRPAEHASTTCRS